MRLNSLHEGAEQFAHSVERLSELRSIAQNGLYSGSSIEPAHAASYAMGTFRIVFSGVAKGQETSRQFAPDLKFTRTSQIVSPRQIVRVEVDVDNLLNRPMTYDELAEKLDELAKKLPDYDELAYAGKLPAWVYREMDRSDELEQGPSDDKIYIENWKERVREALVGTAAANVPIVKRHVPIY
jgi:hypothetical protein